jgi:hypothetical protein
MVNKLSRKVTIALVSIVLYCTFISTFIYIFDQMKYLSFTALWFTFFVLSTPMYLILGVSISFIFDKFKLKSNLKVLVYTLIAGFAVLPYSAFIFQLTWSNAINFFIFGAIGGFFFFIMQVLFENYLYRKNSNEVFE